MYILDVKKGNAHVYFCNKYIPHLLALVSNVYKYVHHSRSWAGRGWAGCCGCSCKMSKMRPGLLFAACSSNCRTPSIDIFAMPSCVIRNWQCLIILIPYLYYQTNLTLMTVYYKKICSGFVATESVQVYELYTCSSCCRVVTTYSIHLCTPVYMNPSMLNKHLDVGGLQVEGVQVVCKSTKS